MNAPDGRREDDSSEATGEARIPVADDSLADMEEHLDAGVAAAWEVEIEKRIRELDDGLVEAIPWSEFRRTLDGPS